MRQRPLNRPPPKFITIEGGEGSGKSTLIRRLEKHFKDRALLFTREPGGSSLGEAIRKILLHHDKIHIAPLAELLLFLAARAQHIEELIRPALDQRKTVICDRFNDSTIAYQGVARKLDFKVVEEWCDKVCGSITPDLTLFLDIDPKIGLERAQKSRPSMDRLENQALNFHTQVREAFHTLAKMYPERIVTIDASQTSDQVFEQALMRIGDV